MKLKLKPELVKKYQWNWSWNQNWWKNVNENEAETRIGERDVIKLKFKLELVKIMNENEAETRTGENYKCNWSWNQNCWKVWMKMKCEPELVNVLFMNMKQEPENGTKNMHYA